MAEHPKYQRLGNGADVPVAVYGARARRLSTLDDLGLPVPTAVALSIDAVRAIASGKAKGAAKALKNLPEGAIFSVRSSPVNPDWGGAETLLNVGMNDATHLRLCGEIGEAAASTLYARFVRDYAVNVARLDDESFEGLPDRGLERLKASLAVYEAEMEEAFPQDPARQLAQVLRSMARAWQSTTARILRQARGAPEDAGLGLIVQEMALGLGFGESGAGMVQFVDPASGAPGVFGRYLSQGQGREATEPGREAQYIAADARGCSLEQKCPEAMAELLRLDAKARKGMRDALKLEFTVVDGVVSLLDGIPAGRSPQAAVRIVVDLAKDGAITQKEALMRIEPRSLTQLLHPQISAEASRDVFAIGLAASPGAVTGRIVFSATAAQASAARGEPCILVRVETTPEDIRGMHSARGVLTERGGMTSHAAVIARGLGLPCVVGATGIRLNLREKTLEAPDGRVFAEGDLVTLDGRTGEALAGRVVMVQPQLDGAFTTLMEWADAHRELGVRANADTPADARIARGFRVDGIGLCRTEHMFFNEDRLTVMREMIFADTQADRRAALDRLLPMQRDDFTQLFTIMQGLPVCIRLFDPPLHEFLPHSRSEMQELAEAMDLPVSQIISRTEDLAEFNPMLGMRGVRIGITVPEIYDMQARAIFEATVEASSNGKPVVPEIMIPLVSAHREVELVKARIDSVAQAVRNETGVSFVYKLGAMVETPRAALRSGDLAASSDFLSFGTNDLTQMTYGLSRDDAGRFMGDYISLGVFAEDPFQTLDLDGVGELMLMAAERGRARNPDIVLSLCGEHGGDPASISFCREAGFDYVSCSPYRVPIARLAAAQSTIQAHTQS